MTGWIKSRRGCGTERKVRCKQCRTTGCVVDVVGCVVGAARQRACGGRHGGHDFGLPTKRSTKCLCGNEK
jgi:hypothetical protein